MIRLPADRTREFLHVGEQLFSLVQPAWVKITETETDTALTFTLPKGVALHRFAQCVEIRPPAAIGERDLEFLADRIKQIPDIDFLDQHLHVAVLVFPE